MFPKKNILNHSLSLVLLFYFIIAVFIIVAKPFGLCWDIYCWQRWANHLVNEGISNAYHQSDINYNPLFLYVLWIYGKIQGNQAAINENIYQLKIFTLLFDMGAILLAMKIVKEFGANTMQSFWFFLNVAFFYNTVLWGQVDAIHSFLIVWALYTALKNRITISLLAFLLAINMKTQSIIFLPILIIIILPHLNNNFKIILKSLAITVILQIIILLPFIIQGTLKDVAINIYYQFQSNPFVSMNAFNGWHFVIQGELIKISDLQKLGMLTFKNIGSILFFITSAFALWPLFKIFFYKNKTVITSYKKENISALFLTAGLIVLLFFFMNTRMHERYSHPAIILLGIHALLSKKYHLYILVSLAYLLNNDYILRNMPHFIAQYIYIDYAIFTKIIAFIYLLIIIGCFRLLYPKQQLHLS